MLRVPSGGSALLFGVALRSEHHAVVCPVLHIGELDVPRMLCCLSESRTLGELKVQVGGCEVKRV